MKNLSCSVFSPNYNLWMVFLFMAIGIGFISGCANEVIKGQADQAKKRETEMARLLEESRKHAASQDENNAELIRGQALLKRKNQEEMEELTRANSELVAENRILKARNEELFKFNNSAEQRLEVQNASFSKKPLVEIIPNNSLSANEFSLEGTKIPPPRRLGENIVLEFSDSLLFMREFESSQSKNNSETSNNISAGVSPRVSDKTADGSDNLLKESHYEINRKDFEKARASEERWILSPSGKEALRQAALEVQRNYPRNIYRLEGHVDKGETETGSFDRLEHDSSWEKIKLVAAFLVREAGISAEQIELSACGTSRPIVENNTLENRQRNRRVEWVIRPERKK